MHRKLRTKLHAAVAVELARAQLDQRELAERLRVPPTTLSNWLTGAATAPVDLRTRIESALGLREGVLAA